MLILGIKRAGKGKEQLGNTARCPHCAEWIKPDARVCRYCGRDVPEPEPTNQWG